MLRRADRDAEARDLIARTTLDRPRAAELWNERENLSRRVVQGDDRTAYQLARDHRLTPNWGRLRRSRIYGRLHRPSGRLKDPRQGLRHYEALSKAAQTRPAARRLLARAGAGGSRRPVGRTAAATEAAKHTTCSTASWPRLPPTGDAAADPVVSVGERDAFERRQSVQVIKRPVAVGAPERTHPFIMRLTDPVEPPTLIQAACWRKASGRPDPGVIAARRAQRVGVIFTNAGYPRFSDFQALFGVDPALTHGVIRQESGFNAAIVSKAVCARADAGDARHRRWWRPKIGEPYAENRLSEPLYNMKLGQRYLATVLESYDGWPALAAAAYNAGPGRVRQWVGTYGDPRVGQIDLVDWIELIPFDETRNYAAGAGGAHVYRALLNNGQVSLSLWATPIR